MTELHDKRSPSTDETLPACICGAPCTLDGKVARYREWECGTSMWIEHIGGEAWKAGARTAECQEREAGRVG